MFTGCWDRREIDQMTFVTMVGVDKKENGDVKLTIQIPTTATLQAAGGGEGGGSQESPIIILDSTGRTIFDAIRNAASFSIPVLFWAHIKVIVFSQEVAREGISKYMDFFARDSELRGTPWVVITPGKAENIVKAESRFTEIPADYVEGLIEGVGRVAVSTQINVESFLERIISPDGNQPFAPRITIRKEQQEEAQQQAQAGSGGGGSGGGNGGGGRPPKKDFLLEGTAVFKQDKMLGWLNREETRGLLWLQGEMHNALIIVKCPNCNGLVVEEIVKANTKVDIKRNNNEVTFLVKIRQEGNIGEQTCSHDFTQPSQVKILEQEINKEIEKQAAMALKKLQDEYNSDIVGFGGALERKYPKIWQNTDWEKEFPKAKIIVSAQTQIRRSGMILQPPFPKKQ